MILVGFLLPLVIYYILIVPIIKVTIINKIENQRKKMIWFWLMILFPVGDHIIGYIIYKGLCLTSGGIKIYKTVTNEQEQRDYWFYDGLNSTECHERDEMYNYLAKNKLVKRNGRCIKLIKKDEHYICAGDKYIEQAYLNYCNDKYNNLPKTDPDYIASCTNANEIIKKYDLKNVIKVPQSPYKFYGDDRDGRPLIPFFGIYVRHKHFENTITHEALYDGIDYYFHGGWYFKLISPPLIGPNKIVTSCIEEVGEIIPNPYKNKQTKGE